MMYFVVLFFVAGGVWASVNGESAREKAEEVTLEVVGELEQCGTVCDDPHHLRELVRKLIVPHFDFARMSRRALGKHWKKMSEGQKKRFISAFSTLLLRTYSVSFREYSGHSFTYLKPKNLRRPGEFSISMQIKKHGVEKFRVIYAMHWHNEGWKVFDVMIEGVSIVKNYRSSFASQLALKGTEGLIALIEKKNRE